MKQASGSGNNLSYKPLIKNISIEPASSNRQKSSDTNNKTFFSNIKAQLNNIRSDANKLLTKDPAKPMNINKSYNVSSANKNEATLQTQASTEKNIDKKPYMQSNQKYGNTTIMTLETKLSKTTNELHQQISKNSQILSQFQQQRKNQIQLRNQITRLKQSSSKLQYQLINKGKQLENCKSLLQTGNKQKQRLLSTIEQLQSELRKNPLKLQRTNSQPDTQTLEKLKQQQRLIAALQNDIRYYQEENRRLKHDLQHVETNKQKQITSILKNCQQKIHRAEAKSYKELGTGFQVKINQLLDENYGLKNKIHQLQNHREQQRVKIESLTSTIQAYEARDRQTGKGAYEVQLENLREKVMELQEQIDKMESEHEFQKMKLENLIDELKENSGNKNGDNKSFNQILKDQINQIENLKQKLKEKTQIINKLKR